ncbi:MAG: GntR family transcriptional regulator, partial [Anaerolineae bacterium]
MGTGNSYLYQEIAESLRRRIASGDLKPGDRLPPMRDMARRWNCTPGTVSRAYAGLARQGLAAGRRGGGT